jgi:predicted branched-subunit amino acid permease
VAAGTLMNGRFLAMGIALAPSLSGGAVQRGAQGQAVVDASWALANRGDGTFDRWQLFGTTAPQYVTWALGTVVGVFAGDVIGDPTRLGLDAIYPTFFLALLLAELRDRRSRTVAAVGSLIALALVPFAPPGVPILAAAAASLIGLARPAGREDA